MHLTSLRPQISDNGVLMSIDVRGRNIDAISEFIEALEQSPAFENVIVSIEEKRDPAGSNDVDVSLTATDFPEKKLSDDLGRQRQQYIFGTILGAIGIVNLLFFLILYRPTRSEYFRLQESISCCFRRNCERGDRSSVTRLETIRSASWDDHEQDRRELFSAPFRNARCRICGNHAGVGFYDAACGRSEQPGGIHDRRNSSIWPVFR